MSDQRPDDRGDLDGLLHDAFGSRHVPVVERPSVLDVQRRARRRSRRRSAAMVGCTAAVALGGAGLWVARQSGDGTDSTTAGEGGAPGATYCVPVVATTTGFVNTLAPPPYTGPATTAPDTLPPFGSMETLPTTAPNADPTSTVVENAQPGLSTTTTIPPGWGMYTLQEGDTPAVVAAKFAVTIESLDFVNANVEGYAAFSVGLQIFVPTPTSPTVTLPPFGSTPTLPGVVAGQDCFPVLPTEWHCTGPLGTDTEGRDVYEYCEHSGDAVATTVIVDGPLDTGTDAITMPPTTTTTTMPTTTMASSGGPTGGS